MLYNVWGEISYSFPNFNGSLGMDKQIDPTLYNGYDHLSMLGLKVIHVSKGSPRKPFRV